MYMWLLLLVLVFFVFFYIWSPSKETFDKINALRNIPLSNCESMCDGVYEYNQKLGRGMDGDQSQRLRDACKTACQYTPFVQTGW